MSVRRENFGSGAPWESIVGYSRAVRAGRRVVVTGTVGEGADAYAQATDALAKIAAALARAGGSLADVVRTRIFVTDIARDWEAVGRAHREALGDVMPATTMVQVGALIAPHFVVEIEADAELGLVDVPAPMPADYNDAAVAGLLRAAGLPVPGEDDAPVQMRVLREDGRVLACAGYERHGDFALLRSVAVDAGARGRGLGRALATGVLDELARAGVAAVCLLTLDAAPFFARLGFAPIPRDAVPAPLLASREFALHHCDSAQTLRREL
ncbi:MAG: GNAT family N-acetyltransferase [Candidatus Latescibacteria bacterium]|nr:GNAT family N-acetyltransferase [bacterium]MCB9513659.1 GNAT family N-acetyltransferase [Candidatus Latescibacterota bacterium]MCB9515498.1 GNAT family N-acetyltransferase [Candidatus Latescibacterota bacterium]